MTGVQVQARLLGALEVSVDGRVVDRAAFERPSGLRVLKLLLATPGHRLRREAAAELLWPEAEPARSAGNLRKAIHFARAALGAQGAHDLLRTEGDVLTFADAVGLDVDLDRLRAAIDQLDRSGSPGARETMDASRSQALQVLAELAGNELLPEDPYEEWLVPLRERLRERVQTVLGRSIEDARLRGEADLAQQLVQRALLLDPADEAAHRVAIELYLEAGQLHASRRQLAACTRAVAEAYGVEPAPELAGLIERAAAERRLVVPVATPETELIGRRRELELTEPMLDAAAAGQVGSVVLRGAPGIGKTRLLREVVRLATSSGADTWHVVELRGLEQVADSAYAALGAALAARLDPKLVEDWPEPQRSAVLTIAPGIQGGGGRPAKTRPLLEFASDAALRTALVRSLGLLAAERKLILSVDDVQWLDSATVRLLAAGLTLVASPVLLVMSLRDEPHAASPAVDDLVDTIRRAGGVELPLGPLGRREIRLLLERELSELADDAAEAIAALAAGTPLYALELLRGARDSGALGRREGRWRLVGARGLPVPAGVRRTVERRADRLPASVRAILRVAAELGDEVGYELLVAASGRDAEAVLDALDDGISLGLIAEHAGRYRFEHPLFRAALRGELPLRARRELHGRIARAMARDLEPTDRVAIGAAMASGADVLAVATHAAHAAEAGDPALRALAVGFGFVAGARHCALFDYEAGVATLRRALALWQSMPPEERALHHAADAHHALGGALKAIGDAAGAASAFEAEIATAADDWGRARGYAALSWLPYEHGRFDRAAEILRAGIDSVAEALPKAFLQSGLGWIRGRQGDWSAAHDLLEPAVAVLERGAPADMLSRALDRLAVGIRDRGAPERSIPVFRRALSLAREGADVHNEAIVRMHLATALRDAGDIAGARAEVMHSIGLTQLTGDRYIEAVAHWILAEVEDTAGRLAEAIAARRAELAILHASGGNPQNQAMAHAHLAHIARRAGDREAFEAEAEAARALAVHAGLDYLPALVERALTAVDWFRVSHRHDESADEAALSA